MKETSKTIAFVVSALALTGLAGVTWQANRPQVISDFGSIGQPFFEDFTSNKDRGDGFKFASKPMSGRSPRTTIIRPKPPSD
jgi:hypothetical protein